MSSYVESLKGDIRELEAKLNECWQELQATRVDRDRWQNAAKLFEEKFFEAEEALTEEIRRGSG